MAHSSEEYDRTCGAHPLKNRSLPFSVSERSSHCAYRCSMIGRVHRNERPGSVVGQWRRRGDMSGHTATMGVRNTFIDLQPTARCDPAHILRIRMHPAVGLDGAVRAERSNRVEAHCHAWSVLRIHARIFGRARASPDCCSTNNVWSAMLAELE